MENVIKHMSPDALADLARCIKWDPYHPTYSQSGWLAANRNLLREEIESLGGHSVINFVRGHGVPYAEIVRDTAGVLKVAYEDGDSIETVEKRILSHLMNSVLQKLTPEERKELEKKANEEAKKHGVNISAELFTGASLTAAHLGGFATYMLASTILGGINGALGLGLSFGAFMGMSQVISFVIGPAGWISLFAWTVYKFGAPDYKKLIPAVVLIAQQRNDAYVRIGQILSRGGKNAWLEVFNGVPEINSVLQIAEAVTSRLATNDSDRLLITCFCEVLQGQMESTVSANGLLSHLSYVNTTEKIKVLEGAVRHIVRIHPDGLDAFLGSVAESDSDMMPLCYKFAPDDGIMHHRAARHFLKTINTILNLQTESATA